MKRTVAVLVVCLLFPALFLAGCVVPPPAPPPPAAVAPAPPPPAVGVPLVGTIWSWVGLSSPTEKIFIREMGRYTMEFKPEGAIFIRIDCNVGNARYNLDADRMLITNIRVTKAACPPKSHAERMVRLLDDVSGWRMKGSELILQLPGELGELRFRALTPTP